MNESWHKGREGAKSESLVLMKSLECGVDEACYISKSVMSHRCGGREGQAIAQNKPAASEALLQLY